MDQPFGVRRRHRAAPAPWSMSPFGLRRRCSAVVGWLLRALWAVGWSMVVLAGLPCLLLVGSGYTLTGLDGEALAPVDDPFGLPLLLFAGVGIGWLLWLWLLYATVADLSDRLRHVGGPVRLPVPLHTAITSLAGGLVLVANAIGSHASVGAAAGSTAGTGPAAAAPSGPTATGTGTVARTLLVASATELADTAQATTGAGQSVYTVRRGDTMSGIAKRMLGGAERWPEICALNWHHHWPKVGGVLRDCDVIYPGWQLRLPTVTPAPAETTPAPPDVPPQQPTPTQPAPPAATPAVPSTPSTSPSGTAHDGSDGAVDPPARTPSAGTAEATPPSTATATPFPIGQPSATSNTTIGRNPDVAGDTSAAAASSGPDGVHLPDGGFVPWALAGAITAAAALVWLQRRRRYRSGAQDDDATADVAALPAPVVELQRRIARNPGLSTPSDPAERAAGVPGLPLWPAGGIGVVGDGAADAARAALISTLASGGPHDPDRRGEIVIDTATLTELFGADTAGLAPWPRLHVADDLDHALTFLDSRLLYRARILDEHGLTDLDALREHAPDEEALPPVLLVCQPPPPDAQTHARMTFALGAGLDVAALLLGAWAHGSTIDVTADGHTHLLDGPPVPAIGERIAVLDTATATAILATLREADTGQPPTPPQPATPSSASRNPDNQPPPLIDAPSEQAKPKARLRVLGHPRIVDITRPGRPLRGKAAELAVYLACHPDGADTRTIGEHLAPDSRLRHADQQVHTNASNLRHVLGRTPAGPLPGGYVIKRGANARYRLDPATVEVDLWQLRDLLTRAQLASGPTRTELLQQACDLYTAPLGDGCDYEWIEPHREQARQCGTEAHLLLADDLIPTDPQAASDLLDQAIGLDRYNEALYRKAMHARHALHDPDGIRNLLRALSRALTDLDAEPEPSTVELAAQLRRDLGQQ